MDWRKIYEKIPNVIEELRSDYVLNNRIIRDDIFGILEKYCIVVYYPLENEKNCGFHIKRYVKDHLEDFVYINSAKTIAEQVFVAAHELGHVWGVAEKVWKLAGEQGRMESSTEEAIINRFAAELLMPTVEFRRSFFSNMNKLECDNSKLRVVDLIRIMVMQMNDYMVPYESVRRRLVETGIISKKSCDDLLEKESVILPLVGVFLKDQNTMLDRVTAKKTIPGLRDLLETAEKKGNVSVFTIEKIKRDFDVDDIEKEEDDIVEISIEGVNDGED